MRDRKIKQILLASYGTKIVLIESSSLRLEPLTLSKDSRAAGEHLTIGPPGFLMKDDNYADIRQSQSIKLVSSIQHRIMDKT